MRSVEDYISETQQTLPGYTNVVLETDESQVRLVTDPSKLDLNSVDLSRAQSVENMRAADLGLGNSTQQIQSSLTLHR